MGLSSSTPSVSGCWYFCLTPAIRIGLSRTLTNSYSTQLFLIFIPGSLTGRDAETMGSRTGSFLTSPGEPIQSPH